MVTGARAPHPDRLPAGVVRTNPTGPSGTISRVMSVVVQHHLIQSVRPFSRELARAIRAAGIVNVEKRTHQDLGFFLSRSVIGQQLSTLAARKIWARIEIAAGEHSESIPDFFHPRVASILRRCGVSGNKVKALQSIRALHRKGLLCSDVVGEMDPALRSAHLQGIWGVGPWTCDMAAIFLFGDPDVWPASDIAVRKTLQKFVGDKAVLVADRCSPYRSTLALYMWRILDGRKKANGNRETTKVDQ